MLYHNSYLKWPIILKGMVIQIIVNGMLHQEEWVIVVEIIYYNNEFRF